MEDEDRGTGWDDSQVCDSCTWYGVVVTLTGWGHSQRNGSGEFSFGQVECEGPVKCPSGDIQKAIHSLLCHRGPETSGHLSFMQAQGERALSLFCDLLCQLGH